MNTVMKNENAALKAAIDETGLSWEDFARQSNIAVVALANILHGRVPATLYQARKIVKALSRRHVVVDASMLIVDLSCDEAQQVAVRADASGLCEIEVQHIQREVNTLRDREREVISMRFGLGRARSLTLAEVARQLRVTRERIRQIEAVALRKLRHPARHLHECIPWSHSDE